MRMFRTLESNSLLLRELTTCRLANLNAVLGRATVVFATLLSGCEGIPNTIGGTSAGVCTQSELGEEQIEESQFRPLDIFAHVEIERGLLLRYSADRRIQRTFDYRGNCIYELQADNGEITQVKNWSLSDLTSKDVGGSGVIDSRTAASQEEIRRCSEEPDSYIESLVDSELVSPEVLNQMLYLTSKTGIGICEYAIAETSETILLDMAGKEYLLFIIVGKIFFGEV